MTNPPTQDRIFPGLVASGAAIVTGTVEVHGPDNYGRLGLQARESGKAGAVVWLRPGSANDLAALLSAAQPRPEQPARPGGKP